jgi:plastocyanin
MKESNFRTRLVSSLFVIMTIIMASGCSKDNADNQNTGNSNTPPNEVTIQSMSYNPSVLNVTAGTRVTWRNKDNVEHTVTSDQALFDSGTIGVNSSYSFTFNTPGTYGYHCQIHTGMTATVVVK